MSIELRRLQIRAIEKKKNTQAIDKKHKRSTKKKQDANVKTCITPGWGRASV